MNAAAGRRSRDRAGFSLIEVVIATAILGASLAALLTYASTCLKVMSYAVRYQEAQRVRSRAEIEYPLVFSNDVTDVIVPEVAYEGGVTYARDVEEVDEEEDGLYEVTTRITWQERGLQREDIVVEYVYFKDEEED